MNKIVKDALILFAITLISGFLLGGVYEITKDPIAKQNQIKKEKAYKAVFEEYEGIAFEEWSAEDMEALGGSFAAELAGNAANTLDGVVTVRQADNSVLGYVITVTNGEGYGGDIRISVGVLADGMVTGVEILSISETPGLGMNAQKDSFKGQFAGVLTESFSYTKSGKQYPDEIDAISSATFTTRSVTNGVNAALAAYRAIAGSGMSADSAVKGGAR